LWIALNPANQLRHGADLGVILHHIW
jgi:hypothetical protein